VDTNIDQDRRAFLKTTAIATAGFTIGFYLPPVAAKPAAAAAKDFAPNAFIRVAPDNSVTVIVKHLEMGQGVYTGLPTLVAEEMDLDWKQVRVESAPADVKNYGNLAWGGGAQGTGGSTAVANSWEQLRKAGASARAMLVAAAAQTWKVPAAEITTDNGTLSHAKSGRKATYGQMAAKAASMSVPQEMKLKDPKEFKYIGKSFRRTDTASKSNGTARFTLDQKLPGMVTAVIARPPVFGGKVKSVNADKARAIKGVREVVLIPQGVAVVAADFWSAKKGRDALVIDWDESTGARISSDQLFKEYAELAKTPGKVAKKEGDASQALASAARKVEGTFQFPFLCHAAMEPMDCVVQLKDGSAEFWSGHQLQTLDQAIAAQILGLKPEQVFLHTMMAGGSFGRRANPTSDYTNEAAQLAKALRDKGMRVPIKLVWTREDDMKGGYYRPAYLHTVSAGLDAAGNPVAWSQRLVGQSILTGTPFEQMLVKDGIDATSVEGAADLPYAIPNLYVDLHTTNDRVKLPVLWWRSVGHTHTAFSTEVMMDELASAAGKDPVAFRRALLAKHTRHLGVLNLVADKAQWGSPLAPAAGGAKRGRGVAVHESFDSYVAEVAEVTVNADGSFKVDRVVCAVDCGVAINPDQVKAQMEGGVGFGLAAALHSAITFKDGRVEQSNFHDYPALRINEMPKVEVHIVPSVQAPTGVGEPGVPPIAPAVANAIFNATGKRVRSLPIRLT
jgi:isoquinoline 1-oxidoreductase beta subunit